jgi:hypothetical protein
LTSLASRLPSPSIRCPWHRIAQAHCHSLTPPLILAENIHHNYTALTVTPPHQKTIMTSTDNIATKIPTTSPTQETKHRGTPPTQLPSPFLTAVHPNKSGSCSQNNYTHNSQPIFHLRKLKTPELMDKTMPLQNDTKPDREPDSPPTVGLLQTPPRASQPARNGGGYHSLTNR